MAESEPEQRVLVVDDEREVADAYAIRLQQSYEVETAYGGPAALETIDDGFDAVLLDRRMPEMSGGEVLERIREAGHDVAAVMVTAVDADFDIVGMPFDAYLNKPVDADEMFDTLDELLSARTADDAVSELFAVTAKIGVLEDEKSESQLAASEEYRQLQARADELRARIDGADDEPTTADAGAGETDTGTGASKANTDAATAREEPTTRDDGRADAHDGGGGATSGGDGTSGSAADGAGGSAGGLSTPAAAVGVGLLVVVALGGTFSSPMATDTKLMVGVGQAVLLVLAAAVGVKHGEYRASA
jgi:DNA-binding response OmpR family regulator